MSDTKRRLAMALKELLQEKPLKKITIQDIVERSHMTRQSFYYHFQDIYEVLELICQYELVDQIAYKEEESFSHWLEHLVLLVEKNRWFYRKLLQELDWARLSIRLRPSVERQVNRLLEEKFSAGGTCGSDSGRALLGDFLTTSIICYLFNFAASRRKQELQTVENLRSMLELCGIMDKESYDNGEKNGVISEKNILQLQ